jgi:hypothetical protein
MMRPESFISFSPGFNRVISGLSDFLKPFQRFTSVVSTALRKRVVKSSGDTSVEQEPQVVLTALSQESENR